MIRLPGYLAIIVGTIGVGGSPAVARPQTLGQLPSAPVGSTPQNGLFDPSNDTVYVANQGGNGPGSANTLSMVDARGCHAGHTVGCRRAWPLAAAGNGPFVFALDRVTHTLYVGDSNTDTVVVINTASCNARDQGGCRKRRRRWNKRQRTQAVGRRYSRLQRRANIGLRS
jgi:hypothetical protein